MCQHWCQSHGNEEEERESVCSRRKFGGSFCTAWKFLVEIFDVDTEAANTTTPAQPQPWVLGLTLDDEQILINGDWLTDSLINAGQQLIQQTFPHIRGLQDVSLAHTLA